MAADKISSQFITCCLCLWIAFIDLPRNLSAQAVVKGKIVDSSGRGDIFAAQLRLFSSDTVLWVTQSVTDGRFLIDKLVRGQYRLVITADRFSTYSSSISVPDKGILDLGTLLLIPKSDTLAPIIVTPRESLVRLKGDTLEYSTAGVQLKAHATVEELLLRLPGVRVDPDGSIFVNGRKVDRLLIDGEDIFGHGSDLKNITRNFNGDLFSKVQVLDKKSDRADFTGIDDGQAIHTLNLVVKQVKKQGYWGKIEGGFGSGDYYNSTGLIGAFREKQQFAALGLASNTGTTGFSGSSSSGDAAEFSTSNTASDALGATAGTGIPQATGGGVHYVDKRPGKNGHLAADYSYGRLFDQPYTSSIIQQLLPDTLYLQRQTGKSTNSSDEHRFSTIYDTKPDTASVLHLAFNGRTITSENHLSTTTVTYLNNTLVNKSNRSISSEVGNKSFDGSLYWNRNLAKGGIISATIDLDNGMNTSTGLLNTTEQFTHIAGDSTDERKSFRSNDLHIEATANYTKNLGRTSYLAFTYGFSSQSSEVKNSTFGKGDGKYLDLIDSLSLDYVAKTMANRAAINLTIRDRKYAVITNITVLRQTLTENDHISFNKNSFQYPFLSPHLMGHYSFDEKHILYFNFWRTQSLPSVAQLQPLQNNIDPLHISIGNSSLRPTVLNDFALRIFQFQPYTANLGIQGSIQENSLSNKVSTDSLGRQITQAVNVQGGQSIMSYIDADKHLVPAAVDAGASLSASFDHTHTFAGNIPTTNNNYSLAAKIRLAKVFDDKYRIQMTADISYVYIKSSVNSAATQYWSQKHSLFADLQLPSGINWNSNCSVVIFQKTAAFAGRNRLLFLDTYFSKDFIRSVLSIKVQAKNLFNQNGNIRREQTGNQISEMTSNNLAPRYFLVTVVYHFIKKNS